MAKILLSAFADEYDRSIDKQIEMLRNRGIGFLEPRFIGEKNISALTQKEAAELHTKLTDANIKVNSIGSPLGKINLADDFDAHLEVAKNTFEVAATLETKNIRAFSFYLRKDQSRDDAFGEVTEKMGRLIDLASTYSLTLCHENEAKIYGESPECCAKLLGAFGGKLRCVFDMGNFVLDGHKPYPFGYELLREYIEYFHIKDSLSAGAIVPAGKGEAQIVDVLKAHKEYAKEDFVITLEPHLETFSGLNSLTDKTFDNPYKFDSLASAFLAGLDALEGILASI